MSKLKNYIGALLGQYAKNSDLASYVKGNDASYFFSNAELDFDSMVSESMPDGNYSSPQYVYAPFDGYACFLGTKADATRFTYVWMRSVGTNNVGVGSYLNAWGDTGSVGTSLIPAKKGQEFRLQGAVDMKANKVLFIPYKNAI